MCIRTYWFCAFSSWNSHRGLEKGTFKEDPVITKGFIYGGKYLFLDLGGDIDAVVAIHQNLWFDNWDKAYTMSLDEKIRKYLGRKYFETKISFT